MSGKRRIIAVLVAALALGSIGGLATTAVAASAKTCPTPNGSYEVSPPPAGSSKGADPAEVAAANCTLGFREDTTYPLSVIALGLLATVATLVLYRRATSHDAIGSEA
jgi:hypothetical protein